MVVHRVFSNHGILLIQRDDRSLYHIHDAANYSSGPAILGCENQARLTHGRRLYYPARHGKSSPKVITVKALSQLSSD